MVSGFGKEGCKIIEWHHVAVRAGFNTTHFRDHPPPPPPLDGKVRMVRGGQNMILVVGYQMWIPSDGKGYGALLHCDGHMVG